TFEEEEIIEEIVEEEEAKQIIEKQIVVEDAKLKETTIVGTGKETVVEKIVEAEIVVEDKGKEVKEVVVIEESGKVIEPAVSAKTSWFRKAVGAVGAAAGKVGDAAGAAAGKVASGAESAYHGAGDVAKGVAIGTGVLAAGAVIGTGLAAHAAIKKVDGVWKRAVQVVTTRKAKVDEKAPVKHAYVYYDEDVYDSIIVDSKTGNKHISQLLYDSDKKVFYVYYRWSETEYTLSDSYETIEEAKAAY
ncbi:hypothetical protein BGX34_007933, partial [Mortierella sp. NVP85]